LICIDTNVLIRYITSDDLEQSEKAEQLIQSAVAVEEDIFISDITLCEVVWVLSSGYKLSREKISAVLWSLFDTVQLKFKSKELMFSAIQFYEDGHCDFADHMIWLDAKLCGCRTIYTFDKKFGKEHGIEVL